MLLRLRGRRPDVVAGIPQRATRHAAARDVRVGHRPLGRAGRARGVAGGVGTGRAWPRDDRRLPRLQLRQCARAVGSRPVPATDGGAVVTHAWRTGTVASQGERIYYEDIGALDAPAFMLTHGAGGSHAGWFQQVPALAQAGFRVITWDCRGFGNSTFTTGVHGSEAAVADMLAVL